MNLRAGFAQLSFKSTGKKSRDDKGREVEGSGEHLNIERERHFLESEKTRWRVRKREGEGRFEKWSALGSKYGRKKSRVGVEGEKQERRCGRWSVLQCQGGFFFSRWRGLLSRRIWTRNTLDSVFEVGELSTARGASPQTFINIQCGLERMCSFCSERSDRDRLRCWTKSSKSYWRHESQHYLSIRLQARTKRLTINLSGVWPRGWITCNQWQEKLPFNRAKPWAGPGSSAGDRKRRRAHV